MCICMILNLHTGITKLSPSLESLSSAVYRSWSGAVRWPRRTLSPVPKLCFSCIICGCTHTSFRNTTWSMVLGTVRWLKKVPLVIFCCVRSNWGLLREGDMLLAPLVERLGEGYIKQNSIMRISTRLLIKWWNLIKNIYFRLN